MATVYQGAWKDLARSMAVNEVVFVNESNLGSIRSKMCVHGKAMNRKFKVSKKADAKVITITRTK